nr:hypothetical protein GCM10020093_011890 [Planobispora longispora]
MVTPAALARPLPATSAVTMPGAITSRSSGPVTIEVAGARRRSRRAPVGGPAEVAARRIGVSRDRPARRAATELKYTEWPELCMITNGVSGASASSHAGPGSGSPSAAGDPSR